MTHALRSFLIGLAIVIATATVAYGGYLGGQMTALWHSVGEVQGQLKCRENLK